MRRFLAVAAVVLLTGGPALAAGEEGELEPLSPPIGPMVAFRNYFGQDVDVDPMTGTIVVGAWGYGTGNAGAAWVIEWDGTGWVYTLLQPSPPVHPARAGSAVAIEGDLIAVGAPFDGRVADFGGAVYLFRRINESWELETVLAPQTLQTNDWFGFHLDIDDGRIAVGAGNDGDSDSAGKVYVYWRYEDTWAYALIEPEDGAPNDYFGSEVYLDGDLLTVGADGVDGEATNQGAVYLYRHGVTGWQLEQRIDPLEPSDDLYFGVRLHGDGERIAVTAAGAFDDTSELGRVHLLTPTPTGWDQVIAYPGHPTYANLGTSIVLDGSTMYVGALGAYNYQRQIGQVLVLAEGPDGWELVDVLHGPTRTITENGFGWSAAGDSGALVIGAPAYRPQGEGSGEVYARVPPRCAGQPPTLSGTSGDDVLEATPGIDVILAGAGDDLIEDVGREDTVCSGTGYDIISGDADAVVDLSRRDFVFVGGVWYADTYAVN